MAAHFCWAAHLFPGVRRAVEASTFRAEECLQAPGRYQGSEKVPNPNLKLIAHPPRALCNWQHCSEGSSAGRLDHPRELRPGTLMSNAHGGASHDQCQLSCKTMSYGFRRSKEPSFLPVSEAGICESVPRRKGMNLPRIFSSLPGRHHMASTCCRRSRPANSWRCPGTNATRWLNTWSCHFKTQRRKCGPPDPSCVLPIALGTALSSAASADVDVEASDGESGAAVLGVEPPMRSACPSVLASCLVAFESSSRPDCLPSWQAGFDLASAMVIPSAFKLAALCNKLIT